MTLDSLPDLDTSGLCLVKTLSTALTVLAVSEHGAPGRRPNIHAQFVGRQTEDGLDTLDGWVGEVSPGGSAVSPRRNGRDEYGQLPEDPRSGHVLRGSGRQAGARCCSQAG